MGLIEGLLDIANATFVSINLVSGVLMGSISTLNFELMLLWARQLSFFRLVLLRARRPFSLASCLIESKLNLDLFTFNFLINLCFFLSQALL